MQFKIAIKPGPGPTGTALLVTHNKCFRHHHFVYSTGIKITRHGFDAARPGSRLKAVMEKADLAVKSLQGEGIPVNNHTLKSRIDLIIRGYMISAGPVRIWTIAGVLRFDIPKDTDLFKLERRLSEELQKPDPDFQKAVSQIVSAGRNSLFGYWQDVVDGIVPPRRQESTRKSTRGALSQTLEIVRRYDGGIDFEDLNMGFYNRLVTWMKKEGFAKNTRSKHIKHLKTVLSLAYRDGLIESEKHKFWSVGWQQNPVIRADKAELMAVMDLELSGAAADQRDIFVLACFLGGMRIGDYRQAFRPENLSRDKAGITWFTYAQEKTGALVSVPVHGVAQAILDKRSGQFPKVISEQKYRQYVKAIFKKAAEETDSLRQHVTVRVSEGKMTRIEKHQAISPHTARRIFASNMYFGWFFRPQPASICMQWTGHRSERSFMKYIGITEKELREKMLESIQAQPVMKVS